MRLPSAMADSISPCILVTQQLCQFFKKDRNHLHWPSQSVSWIAILSLGAVIQAAPRQPDQVTLPQNAQARMFHVNQHALAVRVQLDQSFFWSQSSSTFIWPICW